MLFSHRFRLRCAGLVAAGLLGVPVAGAGPWSHLPQAVARLAAHPGDQKAGQVLAAVEISLVREATLGHLAAVRSLADTYDELVSSLPDGNLRVSRMHRKVAGALVGYGDHAFSAGDTAAAGRAWTLAARTGKKKDAVQRLRRLLYPPAHPQPGQAWQSPVDGATLIWQPKMRFLMGCTPRDHNCLPDEKYLRWVVTPGFWMERTEVTNEQYARCVHAGVCSPPANPSRLDDLGSATLPVVGVSWDQAVRYLQWTGRRLPSEAEWERAARGRHTGWRFPWGRSKRRQRANVEGVEGTDVFPGLAPVASFPATGWGLYDMAGNAWEWCEDSYHRNLIPAPRDGTAWLEGGFGHVVRGGSWRRTIELARVSSRWWHERLYEADDLGFRGVVSGTSTVDDAQIVATAEVTYALSVAPGEDLEAASLDTADRRYLQRRAVTWLLVEGRPWEALPRVAALLGRDPDDPVSKDLLNHLTTKLAREAAHESPEALRRAVAVCRKVMRRTPAMARRLRALDGRLAQALETAGKQRRQAGDIRGAAACFQLALELTPGRRELVKLVQEVTPRLGTICRWPGDGRMMIWIPAGSFLMGRGRGDNEASTDEEPARTVRVHGFWIDRTEVTNAAYRACVAARACTPPKRKKWFDNPAYAEHPVVGVTWFQAWTYAHWAGKRLPTEAEWEYAARAGSATRYPWGDDWKNGMGNAFGAVGKDFWSGTAPVGSFPPNRWGLVDMIGNALEWVEDVFHDSYRNAPEDWHPWNQLSGGQQERQRVLRGGGYTDFAPRLRVSARAHRRPDDWSKASGFRCAADR
ncbi:MAG: formylglycine-generating enzyme family protein [Acidobacteria bacterium]|nr:formylglycine-generating enzyme family protein [Acidobacteriota bacterium]